MAKIFVLSIALIALFSAGSWTLNDQTTIDNTLPTTTTPPEMIGGWSNGFSSHNEVVNAYGAHFNPVPGGTYLKITADGKNAEFFIMGKSQSSNFATQANGTIRFDAESTNSRGSFTFLALQGHYKSWGPTKIDRDATLAELKNNLTKKYRYRMDGEWLRIEPSGEPNDSSSTFRKMRD